MEALVSCRANALRTILPEGIGVQEQSVLPVESVTDRATIHKALCHVQISFCLIFAISYVKFVDMYLAISNLKYT